MFRVSPLLTANDPPNLQARRAVAAVSRHGPRTPFTPQLI